MKTTTTRKKKKPLERQRFPKGWNEKRVQALIEHYDKQTDEEGVAEYETAMSLPGQSMMLVPTKLVPEIRALIARRNGSPT